MLFDTALVAVPVAICYLNWKVQHLRMLVPNRRTRIQVKRVMKRKT